MTGSFMGRGNQYIELVKVLNCKLPTKGKQVPPFPLEVGLPTKTPILEVGGECYHSATMAPSSLVMRHLSNFLLVILVRNVNARVCAFVVLCFTQSNNTSISL